ncbi:MAG: hypothetical protein ACI30D_06325, partial [Muribaculaceae bacterium]
FKLPIQLFQDDSYPELALLQKTRLCHNGPSGSSPEGEGSVIDYTQLPSPSPSVSYHPDHSDSNLSIRT